MTQTPPRLCSELNPFSKFSKCINAHTQTMNVTTEETQEDKNTPTAVHLPVFTGVTDVSSPTSYIILPFLNSSLLSTETDEHPRVSTFYPTTNCATMFTATDVFYTTMLKMHRTTYCVVSYSEVLRAFALFSPPVGDVIHYLLLVPVEY